MNTTKKQYSADKKTKIALEAIKVELTIAQISSKYEVHATQISKWKQQAIESMQSGFTNQSLGYKVPNSVYNGIEGLRS